MQGIYSYLNKSLCTDAFYASLQGGHRLPGLSKSLRVRAPSQGVKESKASPTIFPILTLGPMRGMVDAQRAVPAARLPEELQEQTCPMALLLPACCRAL